MTYIQIFSADMKDQPMTKWSYARKDEGLLLWFSADLQDVDRLVYL